MKPLLSVVVLTLNEEANVADCLASLAAQQDRRFEVILIDAASTDRTLAVARGLAGRFPVPLRIEAATTRLAIGAARNLGVQMAQATRVAFLSADAEAAPDWTARAIQGLVSADMLFGRQLHDPRRWTVGAAVRGLRYDFPAKPSSEPLRLASNVAAAYRKEILVAHPFDPWANAAEDLLVARRAAADGARADYDPLLVVRHHDVAAARVEWRKNVREGEGWAVYRAELGWMPQVLLWGGLLAACAAFAALRPGAASVAALALAVWLPTLRRAVRRRRAGPIAWRALALGLAASPAFDIAFLASYLRGLAARPPQETTT
ncbi:MAG: glycosyltransferase family 2 protein [Thermoplasmatota archaeon]|nr:glycosyltransferase [Halobacteriales archaeon]